jgi:hypothetical protein
MTLELEVHEGMAATWKVGVYLTASLSAFVALLVGLLALSVYPIVGALLTIGGMGLQLYAVAGFRRAPGFKKISLVKTAIRGRSAIERNGAL